MMKKDLTIRFVVFFLLTVLPLPSYAQSQGTAAQIESVQLRPEMPDLFFRAEQRRVLEVIRYGIVDSEEFGSDILAEFTPVVFAQEALPEVPAVDQRTQTRGEVVNLNAFIRNNSTGVSHLWLNNKFLHVDEDKDLIESSGLILEDDVDEGFAVEGSDLTANTIFKVKVGQSINIDGSVEETLPVVVVRKSE